MNRVRSFTDVMGEIQAARTVAIKDQSRAGEAYNAKEDAVVSACFFYGTPVLAIAVLLKRSPAGIAARLHQLALTHSPSCVAAVAAVAKSAGVATKSAPVWTVPDQDDASLDRNDTILRVRKALKARSGKEWSVKGGRGTAWGWISISAAPRDLVDHYMTEAQTAELAKLLGLDGVRNISRQGHSVPSSSDYYREIVDRAEGREPTVIGRPYWD